MFSNYFKTAWRYLTRNKVSSVINILGLSLGIACCLMIYLITSHEMSFDAFHPDKERIFRLTTERGSGMLHPMLPPVRDEITGLETAVMFWNYNTKVRIQGASEGEVKLFEEPRYGHEPFDVIITDPSYFDIFQYEWLAGIPASLNAPNMVVLTKDKAYKYFGDLPVDAYIGKEITYGEALHVAVAGIVKPWTKNTDFIFTDFVSAASIPGSELNGRINMEAWGMWNTDAQLFVKLFPGVDPKSVEAQFPALLKKYVFYLKETPLDEINPLYLQPLADIHFNTAINDLYSHQAHLPTLYGLMAIAAFILIIAVCNFINLYTAQSMQRVKEIAVRKVVGGKRADLIIQFLGETLLVTVFAALLALLLVDPFAKIFHSYVPQDLAQGLLQPFSWLFLLSVVLFTTLLAGFYPAKVSSGVSPISIMKGGTQRRGTKNLLRKSLIVFQFTISLILIICTLIVGDQIHYMMNKDLGFTQDAIININTRGGNRDVFAEKIKQFPFVEMVSLHANPPAAKGHNGTIFKYNDNGEEVEVMGAVEFCDENYIPMYHLKLVAGRNFLPSRYMREAVINEIFARQLGFIDPQDAIGQLIWSGQMDRLPDDVPAPEGQRLLQIVGVTSDFHFMPLYEQIGPILMSATTQAGRAVSVKLAIAGKNRGDVKKILTDIENTYKEISPYERFEATFYDESIAAFYEKEAKTAQIISASMLMAIFISCMGLFGLVMFTTKQRTKEIGIRKVFGASVYDIFTLLSGGFVKLVLLAALIASPVAWLAMNKWMESFAYHVPVRWWIFVLAGLLALIITLATISLQTIKVARANPVDAIKSE